MIIGEEKLKELFAELEGKAYNAEYHNYYYKEANQVIRAFFERTLPPAEGARKVQWSGYGELGNISQKPLQPTAEGAEEILEKHCHLQYNQNTGEREVCSSVSAVEIAMQEFATLHAQRIADKMMSERCKNCKYRGLPDSINEALNSGDGVYRP